MFLGPLLDSIDRSLARQNHELKIFRTGSPDGEGVISCENSEAYGLIRIFFKHFWRQIQKLTDFLENTLQQQQIIEFIYRTCSSSVIQTIS